MTIDWQSIHERLKKNQSLLKQGWQPDDAATIKAVLKSRAEALARPEKTDELNDNVSVMEFELSNERFAFELKHVQEIFSLKDLTFLPCTPSFILGIINLRGQIIAVIDTRKLLGMPEKGLSQLGMVIILQSKTTVMGILADRVIGTRQLNMQSLQRFLSGFSGPYEVYLKGISSEQTVLLDALKIVTDTKTVVNEQV